GVVRAGHEQIDVFLHPRDVLARVPRSVTAEPSDRRVDDFEWPVPHVYEVENRIALPDGFTVPPPPPERVVPLGSATFTERRQRDGQTLIVTFRLDTGKSRLSPAELSAVRAAMATLDEELHIAIDRTAFALGRDGKYRAAITEAERLIALHPAEALHPSQLALLYTQAGAGDAARRAARRAVALAPSDPDALVTLGWVLSHDRLGRGYTHDWDRAGAIAALRKALALDPLHTGAAVELARALARGASGAMFARDADLLGAAEAWHIALARRHTDEHALELAEVLIWSGNPTGAELVARGAAVSEERDRRIVEAIAEARGARDAILAAGELRSGDERGKLIAWAATTAALRRHHGVARALIAELAGSPRLPAGWDKLFARAAPHPAAPPPAQLGDPRAALTDLLLALADPHRASPVFWDAALEGALRRWSPWFAPRLPGWLDRSDLVADLMTSGAVRLEGGAGLWRAAVDVGGASRRFYLALDRGVAKVVGTSDLYAYVGRHVVAAALDDPRAVDQAHQLLAWMRAELEGSKGTNAVLFRRLWDAGEPRSAGALRLAAAVLSAWLDPEHALPVVAQCSSPLPVGQLACHVIRAEAHHRRQRWAEAAAEYAAIRALGADELAPWAASLGAALGRAGRFDDADRVLDEVLAAHPDDPGALLTRYRVAVDRGQPAEAARRADAIAQRAKVTASELNQLAWSRLAEGGDLPSALVLARRAVEAEQSSSAVRNTLAAIEAELGDLGPAEADQRGALRLHGDPPNDSDWYVAARIDEQLGLVDDAVAIYKKIATAPDTDRLSAAAFARRRLAALGRAP
ncbi:MAG TPA: hypothetical protein VK601_01785, partial [Kofleriaceae bacterium]|nr:hypothetical protein [Kofleriaceae bacterium]